MIDSTIEGLFTFSEKSRNSIGWLEWVVMDGREFSFVEKQYTRKYSKLKPIGRKTLVSYIQMTNKKVETQVTDLRPVKQQTTRRSSTFAMIQRYQQLKEFLNPTNAQIAEDLALSDLFTQLKKFESVSMKLQEDSIDLATAKILFYALKMDFEDFEHYLGDDGICANPAFESAIVTAFKEKPLTPDEKLLLQPFANRQVVQEIGPEAAVSYAKQLLNRRKLESDLGNLKWIPPTSNLAGRLLSRVKFLLSDYRKSLLPINLEAQIFLCANKNFWDLKTIHSIVNQ